MNRRTFLFSAFAATRHKRRKAQRAPGLLPQERPMLLRSFRDEDIERELRHRWLTAFSVEEIEGEAARRGLR